MRGMFLLPFILSVVSACSIPEPLTPQLPLDAAKVAATGKTVRCGGPTGSFTLVGGTDREPIRSSMLNITEKLLRDPREEGATFARQGFRASLKHDLCYFHGAGTFGRSKDNCDIDFGQDALDACRMAYSAGAARQLCNRRAELAYTGVHLFGGGFYGDNPQTPCDYEAGTSVARSAIVQGRFPDMDGRPMRLATLVPEADGTIELALFSDPAALSSGQSGKRTTIDVSGIEVRHLKDSVCRNAHCMLSPDLGMNSDSLLAREPLVMDIDGDGRDDIVLSSFNASIPNVTPQSPDDDIALGMLMIPVHLGPDAIGQVDAAYMTTMSDSTKSSKASWKLDKEPPGTTNSGVNADGLSIQTAIFRDPPMIGRVAPSDCEKKQGLCAEQAIFTGLNTRNEEGLEVHTFEFVRRDGDEWLERQRLAVSQEGPPESVQKYRHWVRSACKGQPTPEDDGLEVSEDPNQEIYKRAQYEPSLVRSARKGQPPYLVFSFREKFDANNSCLVRRAWQWNMTADDFNRYSQYGYDSETNPSVKDCTASESKCGQCGNDAQCLQQCIKACRNQSPLLGGILTAVAPDWDQRMYPWFTIWPDSPDPFSQPDSASTPTLVATYLNELPGSGVSEKGPFAAESIYIAEANAGLGISFDDKRGCPDGTECISEALATKALKKSVAATVLTPNQGSYDNFGYSQTTVPNDRTAWMGEYFQTAIAGERFGPKGEFGFLWVRPSCPIGATCGPDGKRQPDMYRLLIAYRRGVADWEAQSLVCHAALPGDVADTAALFRNAPLFTYNGPENRSGVYAPLLRASEQAVQLVAIWPNANCVADPDIIFTARPAPTQTQ